MKVIALSEFININDVCYGYGQLPRRATRTVKVGSLAIGGGTPISVQSMLNVNPHDEQAVRSQLRELVDAGCEIARLTVPDQQAADVLAAVLKDTPIPLVADIHFDYRLAIAAIEAGVHKVRINPGNIGSRQRVAAVVAAASERQVPIRIGVNSGSLERSLLEKYKGPTAAALAESALSQAAILEELGHSAIVLSAKASDVPTTIETYRILAQNCDYPLHIGVTEAGTLLTGSIRTAVGLGILLWQGIGDTLRVSLTGDPVPEVKAGFDILKALDLRKKGPVIISCPTCGRTRIDLPKLTAEIEKITAHIDVPLHIAVMGCAVNGPGEAREADLGIASGNEEGLIFRQGRILKKVPAKDLLSVFKQELADLVAEIRKKE